MSIPGVEHDEAYAVLQSRAEDIFDRIKAKRRSVFPVVNDGLASLPQRMAQATRGYYVEGRSVHEIAEDMHVQDSTVRGYLSKAGRRLGSHISTIATISR